MRQINYDLVSAMRPEYIQYKGDCTEIIYESRETYTAEKNVNSVIKTMAHYYCTDLKANRKNYGDKLTIKNLIPIIFSDKHILVAYKARKPDCKRDGAYGYIDYYKYSHIEKGEINYIVLTNGIKLELHQKPKQFEDRIIAARLLSKEKR
ncbi:MAG: competence protein ComK [Dethiosulfatibacter sp.]|nr:competence protein ComK [Dethiosulfatibacter sp.]